MNQKMNKKLNVLSLFDGISTGMLSLKELGYDVNYYASEIDESAIKVSKKNFPEITHLGDVKKVKYMDGYLHYNDNDKVYVGNIHVLIGGSPCQDLSPQHKVRKGLKGEQSSLFYEYLRLYNKIKPKYFLLENVKMKKDDETTITNLLGVEPININSELVSAQKRDRLYWTNIPGVKQPENKNIKLQDIIESGFVNRDKSFCITESACRQVVSASGFRRYMMGFGQYVFESKEDYERKIGKTEEDRINFSRRMRLINSADLKYGVDTPVIRNLTPNEVEQLQTMPIDYTYEESLYYSSKGYNKKRGDSKRISLLGEGWTKDIIVHILKNMKF